MGLRSTFDPSRNIDGSCLRGVFRRDRRGRFVPRSGGELEETLAQRLAHAWGLSPTDTVDGERLDARSAAELRRMLRHGSRSDWLAAEADRHERQAQREEAWRQRDEPEPQEDASFDPAELEAVANLRRNPWTRSQPDGSLDVRFCRGHRGRFLPNPPVGDALYPWDLPQRRNPPGFQLQGRSDEVLNRILERFRDPASLPKPLAQVFVRHEATHASRLSLMNQFIIAMHGEAEAMGFQQWKELGRSVRKGGKGMAILAPLARTIEVENDQGQPDKRTIIRGFRHVVVFGLSQTDGEPYQLAQDDGFLATLPFLDVAAAWGLNVTTYTGGGRYLGFFAPQERTIALGVKNAATFAHELIHAADHRLGQLRSERHRADKQAKADAEIVAELGGATLLAAVGQDEAADLGGAYEYLQSWSPDGDARLAAFRVLDRVLKAVQLVIGEAQRLAGTATSSPAAEAPVAPAVAPQPSAEPAPVASALPSASQPSVPPTAPAIAAVPAGGRQLTLWDNPARSVIGLGRLLALIVRQPDGRRVRIAPQDERWLAWRAAARELLVLRPGRGPEVAPAPSARRGHAYFHGAPPAGARPMVAPTRGAGVRALGLLESLTYTAAGIASPTKRDHHWIHQFGDRGERGHGRTRADAASPYPERAMPLVEVNAAGDLFIRRRPGNRYTVRDWVLA